MEEWRTVLLGARLLAVEGLWQCSPAAVKVRHLVARRFRDFTPLLGSMKDALHKSATSIKSFLLQSLPLAINESLFFGVFHIMESQSRHVGNIMMQCTNFAERLVRNACHFPRLRC